MSHPSILVVGGGAREHALCWRIAQSIKSVDLFCAPGNAGTEEIATNVPIASDDIVSLINFSRENDIDLIIVGPEKALALGIVDLALSYGIPILGPTQRAARIESSKAFAKQLMKENNIHTASSTIALSYKQAVKVAKAADYPCVVKADGLADGKGAVICYTIDEAIDTLDLFMNKKILGIAGEIVVIEKFLNGIQEYSMHVLCQGEEYTILPFCSDYKKRGPGPFEPNTGGMGVISIPTSEELLHVEHTAVKRVLHNLVARGTPYSGILYPGLILTDDGTYNVLEYNCRFGDPEAQVLMHMLEDDFIDNLWLVAEGHSPKTSRVIGNKFAICIVLASEGYPSNKIYPQVRIYGLDRVKRLPHVQIFHAATIRHHGQVYSNGGRVISVTATGHSLVESIDRAYGAIGEDKEGVHFENMYYRTDIGAKFHREKRE